jgi:uncharacterized protein
MNIETSILTYSGLYMSLTEPDETQFNISDIAHALSQICRFGGHTRQFYSVAQHSVLVSHLVPKRYQLQALLHDAAESYCGDMVHPMKFLPTMGSYRDYEGLMQMRLFEAFGVTLTADSIAAVKQADLTMLATERRDLMAPDMSPWPILDGVTPRYASILPLMPMAAEAQFLKRFKELAGVL